ncbi:putative receptor-type tyrosine-protein phosphatase U [Scophthalmus maximus]|uniref:Putative receptor-type tyrosine-protein phosphatase U n=1 Tax=Scophthalmus maximus TaxID=52904 RepID=A0A2U9AZ51_SCOMX|nr:putative receptor-type tyrosine-protein phosphatase U [Scophthalmus maximus]
MRRENAAGCTFEEDSEPSLCDFTQGEEDDFDWLLFRTYSSPYASSDLLKDLRIDGADQDLGFVQILHRNKNAQRPLCTSSNEALTPVLSTSR